MTSYLVLAFVTVLCMIATGLIFFVCECFLILLVGRKRR